MNVGTAVLSMIILHEGKNILVSHYIYQLLIEKWSKVKT